MKRVIKIGLLCLLNSIGFSKTKQQQLDSLHTALKYTENDTIKMSALYSLYGYYVESNRDSALLITVEALNLSKKINQPLWTANLLLRKAYVLQKQGNLPLVFKLINEAMDIAKDEKNEKNAYIRKGHEFAGDPHKYRLGVLAGGFHQLGNLYSQVGNKEQSIAYYQEEIRIAKEIKSEVYLLNSNMNIGAIYLDLDKLDSAQLYLSKALAYSNSTKNKTYQGNILEDIGTIYFKQRRLDSARCYYGLALSVSRDQNNLAGESSVNISLAKLYESISQIDSMLYYAKAAFNIATNLKVGNLIGNASHLIASAFEMQGAKDSAFAYLSISKTTADSLSKIRIENLTQFQNINFEEQLKLEKSTQESIAYKNKIRTTVLFGGLGLLSVLAFVFYRNNRQKQKDNAILESTLTNLKSTQSQLIQSEKMASLGELTAGIAHEIQNPLNFVNNFSEVNKELLVEMKDEIDKGNLEDAKALANDIIDNEEKINHHGKRADAIVKGMLQHSRSSSGVKEPTDINALADEYLRLAYHGLRAKDKSFNATMKTDYDESIGDINIIPQDMGRVILNLITNAFYAASLPSPEKIGRGISESAANKNPTVWVSTKKVGDKVLISVKDNGPGIPQKILDKIFQPFFTTKPTGQGTGLGLSLSYDIVKALGGEIKVSTEENEGTEFTIVLPA